MTASPSIVIGVVPRERFALTAEVLRRIEQCTREPHRLVVVDCAMPEPHRSEVEAVVAGLPHAEILRFDRHLLPNDCRNRVIEATDEELVCLIDNDVLVEPGWLTALMAGLEEESVGLVRPYVIEGLKPHFDPILGPLEFPTGVPAHRVRITQPTRRSEFDPEGGRRPVEWLETHCMLFRRSALDRIGPLDPELNTRDHVDLALTLRAAGVGIVFEPASRVRFVPPPPVRAEERPFFSFRWDADRALASSLRIASRWNLVGQGDNLLWVRQRHWRTSRPAHWLRQAFRPVHPFLRLLGDIRRPWESGRGVIEHLRGLARDYLARRRFPSLAAVQSGEFKSEIREANARTFRAGPVSFAIEARLPPSRDPGGSIHVFTDASEGRIERLRFDCLEGKPHYHYVLHDQGISQKFWIDPLLVPDAAAWSLERIRCDLASMLDAVGGPELAALVDEAELEHVLPELEAEMDRVEAATRVERIRLGPP